MECICGPALDKRLKDTGPLDAQEAVRYFDQLASALSRFHAQGMYHGAIRPSNILLDACDLEGRAILSVHWRRAAKHLGDGALTFEELTYLTPEQYVGGETDQKTDQYQLGQLLYETLTGEPLARVNVLADFAKKQATFTAPVVSALAGSNVASVRRFRDALVRMLSADPGARWPSIDQARQAVREAVNGIDPMFKAAQASFERCMADQKFFPSVYAELFAKRGDLQTVFHGRNTNFDQQYVRLRAALVLLLEAGQGAVAALRAIEDYGDQHREMGIKPDDYDAFVEAIVGAARKSEGHAWNDSLEEAWRASLATGIDRMKRAAAPAPPELQTDTTTR
jgi:hemoglobin-like flavoprotein